MTHWIRCTLGTCDRAKWGQDSRGLGLDLSLLEGGDEWLVCWNVGDKNNLRGSWEVALSRGPLRK